MSYLPSFEYDIFISYHHADNVPLTRSQRGWIEAFHDTLQARLPQVLGADVVVWRDQKLAGNDIFDDSIPRRVRKSAILISIVTPGYLRSQWCLKELQIFRESAEASGGVQMGDLSRIYKVLKTPSADTRPVPDLPDWKEWKGPVGYEFFEVDRDGIAREIYPDLGKKELRQFYRRIDDVARHIRDLLTEFNADATIIRSVEAPAARSIYLAETTGDLRQEGDAVRRELRQRGFRVLPEGSLPHTPDFRDQVRERLRQCELSVHLVGHPYGIVPECETSSVVAIQYALAGERIGRGGFTRVAWLPPAVNPEDERQREFLQALRTDPTAQEGTEILEGAGIEDLKTTIRDVLDRLAARKAMPPADAGVRSDPVVYVICDPVDLERCLALRDYLFEQGVEAVLPLMEEDEAKVRENHQQNLIDCDAALVFWGRADEAWLRTQLRELQKARGAGRNAQIALQGLYLAAPSSSAKARFLTRQALMMAEADTFSASLRPFLDRLFPAS